MARRGRFTNPNAGGQNLSSLILSLLKERKAAEEQVMIQKFRNQEITAEEMLAFYDNWASTSGYTEGTLEYEQINQRKKEVYDTGIKYKWDALLAKFNKTGGANYLEVMAFLSGTAQTVNDINLRQQYLDLRKTVTTNFINSAEEKLKTGEMSLREFKAAVYMGLNGAFEKGTTEYRQTQYSIFIAEYNSEYSKYQNRMKAGKSGAYSDFIEFANGMKQELLNRGIGADSELFTRLEADIASAGSALRAAGSNAQLNRASTAGNILGEIYGAAIGTSGVPGVDMSAADLASGKTYSIADVAGNPAALSTFIRLLETGAAEIPQNLRDKYGINSIDDLKALIDTQVRTIDSSTAAAYRINPTNNNSTWAALGKTLARTIGTRTQVDEIADAMNQYASDIATAGQQGDDVGIARATDQWRAFLAGQTSSYGKLDKPALEKDLEGYGPYGVSFGTALKNTEKGVAGGMLTPGDQALEDFFGVAAGYKGNTPIRFGDTYADGSIPESLNNYNLLTTGQKVQVVTRDPATGEISKVTTDRVAAGPTGLLGTSQVAAKNGGYLTVITYVDGIGGAKVPVVQSIAPTTTIQTPAGTAQTPWGYKYVLNSGKEIWIQIAGGKAYDTNPFASSTGVEENGVVFSDGKISPGVDPMESIPAFDVDSILGGTPKGVGELRAIADKLKELTTPGSAWADALGAVDLQKVQGQIAVVTDKANKLEIAEIQTRIFLKSERGLDTTRDEARLTDLKSGGVNGYNYENFVLKNKDRYKETAPGVFELIQPTGPGGSAGGYALGYGRNLDPQGRELPTTVDIRDPENIAAAATAAQNGQPNPFTTGLGGFGYLNQGAASNTLNVAGDVLNFFRNKPTAPKGPSYLGSNYQGGAPKAPPTINAPTISPALMPFNAADREERRALIAAQSQTVAPALPPPPRPPTTFGGK